MATQKHDNNTNNNTAANTASTAADVTCIAVPSLPTGAAQDTAQALSDNAQTLGDIAQAAEAGESLLDGVTEGIGGIIGSLLS